jgi:hypothetical protein
MSDVYYNRRVMNCLVSSFRVALSFVVLSSSATAFAANRATSFVIVDPELSASGAKAQSQIDLLMRRFEIALGWKKGDLVGKGFTSIKEADAFLKSSKPAFGLLPAYEFAALRKLQNLEVLGSGNVWEPRKLLYQGLSLRTGRVSAQPHQQDGLRLATHITDMQWLNVIFDGFLHPATHFKFVPARNEAEAVAAVREKKADLAIVWGEHTESLLSEESTEAQNLKVAFNSGRFPPVALVAFRKNVAPKKAKALVKAMGEVCKGKDNIDVCASLGFLYLKAGPDDYHEACAYKYENYK